MATIISLTEPSNILGDAAFDAAAAAFGAKMGGGTGAALAVVGVKNPAAVPGMSAAGAKVGSAAAVVLSRASKALARVVASAGGSGNGKKGGGDEKSTEKKPSTEEVRRNRKTPEQKNFSATSRRNGAAGNRKVATSKDADNYLTGLRSRRVLSDKGVTKDGHDYFRFERKCEYNGIQFKKGDYISRDTLHNEWEWFRGAKNHKGAVDPVTGKKYKDSDPGRTLKLP